MDLSKIPLLSGLAARLDFLSARTAVIAENIANADTPDYTAKDLKQPDFRALAQSAAGQSAAGQSAAALRVSDARHISTPGGAAGGGYQKVAAPDGEASLTGNQVSVETQAMKLSETRMAYGLASSVYRKGLSMLRLAARGN